MRAFATARSVLLLVPVACASIMSLGTVHCGSDDAGPAPGIGGGQPDGSSSGDAGATVDAPGSEASVSKACSAAPATRVTAVPGPSYGARIATTGTSHLVAWTDERQIDAFVQQRGVFAASLGANVSPPAQDVRVTSEQIDATMPSLVANGAGYALVLQQGLVAQQTVMMAMIDANGSVSTPAPVTSALDLEAPAIAWNGTEYAVVWSDHRAVAHWDLYMQRVAANGQPVGSEVHLTSGLYDERRPRIAWHDGAYAVAWEDSRDGFTGLYLRRFDAAGAPLDAEKKIAAPAQRASLVASDAGYAVAWMDVGTTTHVRFAALDATGALAGAPEDLWGDGSNPSVSWTGEGFGVAFHGFAPTNMAGTRATQIHFRELDRQGRPRAPDLAVTTGSGASGDASIAWSGSEHVLAWHGPPAEIYAARITCK